MPRFNANFPINSACRIKETISINDMNAHAPSKFGVMYTNTMFSIDILYDTMCYQYVTCGCNVDACWLQNANKYVFVYWNGNFIKY